MSKSVRTTYSNYNKHILEAGTNTATIKNHKNKVWFHFSCYSLLPLIKSRDELLYYYRTLGIGKVDLSETKIQPCILQLAVHYYITLAKS